jgi:hypothetical protein
MGGKNREGANAMPPRGFISLGGLFIWIQDFSKNMPEQEGGHDV